MTIMWQSARCCHQEATRLSGCRLFPSCHRKENTLPWFPITSFTGTHCLWSLWPLQGAGKQDSALISLLPHPIARAYDWAFKKYFKYEVACGLYNLDWWEKIVISTLSPLLCLCSHFPDALSA